MANLHAAAQTRVQWAAVAVTALLAGCGGAAQVATSQDPLIPYTASATPALLPDSGPPACKGQKNSKQYATLSGQGISTKGGSVCVPAFGTWGGSLQYPAANAAAQVTLTSSTTAYQPGLFPPPGSKSPVFYLQLAVSTSLTFGSTLPAGDGIASPKIVPKKPYTVTAALDFGSLWQNAGSCYSLSKKVKYGGGVGRVGAVLIGKHLSSSTTLVIEIFSGKLVTNKC